MKNKIIYAMVIFGLGYITNNIVGDLIRPAYAYCDCSESDFNFGSYDIYNFRSAVESIVEDCSADEDGNISC